ncbi:ankyrin repeat-containing domain protein, partial [Sphaerosporella brunnea]
GSTPLMLAAHEGTTEGVGYLIEAGADIAVVSRPQAQQNYMLTAESGDWDTVKLLLDAGADPFIPDEVGKTCIDSAVSMEHQDIAHQIVDWLIQEKIWPNPFGLAIRCGSRDLIILWLNHRPEDLA